MTEPHLVHRLPWRSLAEVFVDGYPRRTYEAQARHAAKHRKRIDHFVRCLVDALKEFAATDQSSEDERKAFDPALSLWNVDRWSMPNNYGYPDSLIRGYLELNLILTDADKLAPLILYGSEMRMTTIMEALCGTTGSTHPAWLAEHLQPVFDSRYRLKPLTAELRQRIRDHCALLFRCMYTLSKDNVFFDVTHMVRAVEWMTTWQ